MERFLENVIACFDSNILTNKPKCFEKKSVLQFDGKNSVFNVKIQKLSSF
jgi:hypothetical protein